MMEILGENALGFATFEEAAAKLHEVLKPQDTVMLKASRGMAFERFLPILEEFGGGRHE
jgi:UDP-N-acetylmuramoyl-tripeptide--D-alanyl-D-alanine ligase